MLIPLKLVRDQQLQQQIFDQLRELIVSHRLRSGSRMPSTRMLAEQFAISRMTVLLTYERLIAEGYLETRPAAGTFVAHHPGRADSPATADTSALSLAHQPANSPARVPPMPRGEARPTMATETCVGGADASLFPVQRWRSLMRAGLDRMGAHHAVEHPAGNPELREAIANWLSTSRGLAVSPDQVMPMSSRQQALHAVAHLASRPCDGRRAMMRAMARPPVHRGHAENGDAGPPRIIVEDPCDAHATATLASEGVVVVRVPVDADGLETDQLPDGEAVLIHVTPEHQRPLGSVLSHDRRAAVLYWAERAGALVLEEDIDGEVRYGNMDVPSLMSLDRSERVILLGGFSVSLGPWLDVAYLVLPRWLVPFGHAIKRLIDDSQSGLEQTALAGLLSGGGYARHLHRLTKAYASRRDALLSALRRHFDGPVVTWGQQAGLHLAWLPAPESGSPANLAALARLCGLTAIALPVEPHGRSPASRAVLIGFGLLPERLIEARVGRLAGLAHAEMGEATQVRIRSDMSETAGAAG